MARPLRVLTWHVHGNYLYNLTQVPHEFWLVTDAVRSTHRSGRSGTLPWGDNVHEAPAERLREMVFDVVLYQSADAWDDDRLRLLSPAQRRLPQLYLEHDPPQAHPTDSRHRVADSDALLVHVTPFNALMWDAGSAPTAVVEHGIRPLDPTARWHGTRERGIVVVNNLDRRGRRLGLDLWRDAAARLPLTLVGMGSERVGGDGEVAQQRLPALLAEHRFFFHPIRWTSLGLAAIEAMWVGLPIVALATTEMATVVRDGVNGFIDSRPERLHDAMRALLDDPALARRLGDAARETALQRFHIDRFVADWDRLLRSVAG